MPYDARMKISSLRVHGAWAVAAVGAFAVGSLRDGPGDGGARGSGDTARTSARGESAGGLADAAAERRLANRRDRDSLNAPTGGRIAALFGSVTAAGAGVQALAEQALRDPNPITRRLAFSRLLEALTPENAGEIREQLVALGANGAEWNDFHYSWGALAGIEAFDHAAASDEEDLAATLTGWAAARPAEALALLDNLPEHLQGQRDKLAESIVAGLADTDRSMATELVLRLAAEGNGRAANLIEIVAGETLRAEGPEAAARWSSALPDGPLKASAMNRVADQYARKNPQEAALWVQTFAAQDYAAGAVARVSGQWVARDPEAAVGWLETLPGGNGQNAGFSTAFGDWEDRDPVAAGQYLMAMQRSPQRDAAISGFSSGYAWQNPQVAIEWANDISDPALRQQTLTRAGQAYFRRDPESARAWLESSNLPPEAQQQVLNPRR